MGNLRITTLEPAEIETIHARALDILERVGVRVADPECRQILERAGGRIVGAGETVCLPRQLIQETLALAPSEFEIHRIDGVTLPIAGRNRFYGSLVIDPWIIDYETQTPRRPLLADVVRHTRLGDALPRVDFLYRMDMPPDDLPAAEAYTVTLAAFAANTTKHMMAAPATAESLQQWLEVAEILAGARALSDCRLISIGAPVTTPLQFGPLNGQILKTTVRRGLAFIAQTEPIAGTTAPFSFAGGLLMGHAENLFLVAMTQLVRAGAPIFYSSGNALTDMTTGRVTFYNADKMLWKIGLCQLADYLGLPVEGESSGSLVGRYDIQCGIEYGLLGLPTPACGRGIFNGLGSCYNACGMSAEFVVIQADMIDLLERISGGIDVSEAKLGLESIVAAGPGGHFLEDPLTLKLLRAGEFYTRGSFDRLGERSPNDPLDSMLVRAHARVEQLLGSHRPAVSERTVEELAAWARRRGVTHDVTAA